MDRQLIKQICMARYQRSKPTTLGDAHSGRALAGSWGIVAPSIEHARVLQQYLNEVLPQTEILVYTELPKDFEIPHGSLVFIEHEAPFRKNHDGPQLGGLGPFQDLHAYDYFLSKDILLVNDEKVVSLRDASGYRYGDPDENISSEAVLSNWNMVWRDR